jgi:heptosyltransferase I
MPKFSAEKICLIRTSAVGDTVHALALANGFITFDRKTGARGWADLIRQLRRQRFDLAVIPQVSAKVSLISLFARAKVKLGFDWSRSRELHWLAATHHIAPRPMGHVQDQFFEFLDYLEIRDYPKTWDFCFTARELQWQQAFFERIGRPALGFVIATAHPEKDWPPAFYARVMDAVESRVGLQPVMIRGPSARERQIAEEIASLCRCRPVAALEKSIRHTMLQGCRMVVSPDTGPLHMAVALGVPTIGLYGYSDPRRCGPYRFRDLLIDHYNVAGGQAAPITRKTRPGRMETIDPAEVLEKIEYGLQAYEKPPGLQKVTQ